jgi:hypothetical protein
MAANENESGDRRAFAQARCGPQIKRGPALAGDTGATATCGKSNYNDALAKRANSSNSS